MEIERTADNAGGFIHSVKRGTVACIWRIRIQKYTKKYSLLFQYTACHRRRFPVYYFKNPAQSPCGFQGLSIQNILNILKNCLKKRASILGKASPKEASWRFCPWFPPVGAKTAKGHNRSWHTMCARHGRDDCLCLRKATPSLTFRGYHCDA